jgi:Rrf2 family iron-sulfur cluster assembly transcriptional regulator
MKLSRQEEIAVLTVIEIADASPLRVSIADIVRKHGISPLFLKKILRLLRSAHLVISKEGSGGGYLLAKDPNTISVYDIFLAVSGTVLTPASTIGKSMNCPLSKECIPHKVRMVISTALSTYLSDITIDQLLTKGKE